MAVNIKDLYGNSGKKIQYSILARMFNKIQLTVFSLVLSPCRVK